MILGEMMLENKHSNSLNQDMLNFIKILLQGGCAPLYLPTLGCVIPTSSEIVWLKLRHMRSSLPVSYRQTTHLPGHQSENHTLSRAGYIFSSRCRSVPYVHVWIKVRRDHLFWAFNVDADQHRRSPLSPFPGLQRAMQKS